MNKSLNTYKVLFEEYLAQNKFTKTPSELYEPNNYILQLGGKRLRPIMVLLGYELFEQSLEKAFPAALAIEYFHNFSLMHDDIMDEASLRRGKATVHKKFGVNEAILSGDVLLIYAYQSLSNYDAVLQQKLVNLFSKTAIEVCEGQSMDTSFEQRMVVKESEYIEMIRLKTAVLLASALKMGALIGGSTENQANLLYEYGENLGNAFQIQDDILDTYGDKKVGKKIGGDIVQNKKTLLLIKALELSEKNSDNRLAHLIKDNSIHPDKKIEAVISIYKEYQVLEYSVAQKESYVRKAMQAFEEINHPNENLSLIAEQLTERQF